MAGFDPATGLASTQTGATWVSTLGAVSVGNGTTATRQITGVAAGTTATDAVNVAQLSTGVSSTNSRITLLSTSTSTGLSSATSGIASLSAGLSTTNSSVTLLSTSASTGLSTAVISHRWENGQNYLYYEALDGGYLLIHNSRFMAGQGFFYPDFDNQAGATALRQAQLEHDANLSHDQASARAWLKTLDVAHEDNVRAYTAALQDVLTTPA